MKKKVVKNKKPTECYLDIEPYRRKAFVILGTFEKVDARLKKLFDCGMPEGISDACGAVWQVRNVKKSQSFSILWLDDLGLDSITHEVFHLTRRVMEGANLPLNEETDEAYAYLNGWLNEKIIAFVNL